MLAAAGKRGALAAARGLAGSGLGRGGRHLVGGTQGGHFLGTTVDASSSLTGFVSGAMGKGGLDGVTDETLGALKNANVLNLDLLFKLTPADLHAAGVSVGPARLLQDAIQERKRQEVMALAGERAAVRRSLSTKQRRGF